MVYTEKAMATHSSTLAWKIPWMEEPGRLQSMGSWRVRHNWAISLWLFTFMHWRRKWQPSSVLAWRIPGTGEPGGLPPMGLHRLGHDWSNLAAYIYIYIHTHTPHSDAWLCSFSDMKCHFLLKNWWNQGSLSGSFTFWHIIEASKCKWMEHFSGLMYRYFILDLLTWGFCSKICG